MNQRERILAILVGGLLITVVISYAFGKYKTALRLRTNQIAALTSERERLNEQILQGEYANRQMGEYMVRSLSGNPERAQSDYQQWLLDLVQANKLSKATVDKNSSRPIGGLYQQIDFRVQGNTDLPNFVNLLYDFYAKDYLHRIRDFSLLPSKEGDYRLELSIDTIALLNAPDDLPSRTEPSYRVGADVAEYRDPILNRNFFEPPNAAPEFNGQPEIEAIVGRDSPTPLTFRDPEGHAIRYEFAQTPPPGVELDERSGTLRVRSDEKQEFEVLVRAIDNGYPRRTTEQKLTVRVVDPPPPPVEPEPQLAFDDSTQTVLTALVQGRDEWTAWMNVRTRAKTLKLRIGDEFEIGRLKGAVVEATPRYLMLEVDGRRFSLEPGDNLSDAARRSEED